MNFNDINKTSTNNDEVKKNDSSIIAKKLDKVTYSKKELEDLKDIQMQIDGFLPHNHISMIYAPSNTGKTTASLGLVNYILQHDEEMKCYYCDYDNGANTMKPQLLTILNQTDRLHYISHDKTSKEVLKSILYELTKTSLEKYIFVFDSLQHFVDGDISTTKSEPALKELFELMKKLRGVGATIIVLSHTTKEKNMEGKETTFRGLNIIKDNVDNLFYLIREGNSSYIFQNQKSRAKIAPIVKTKYNHDEVLLSNFNIIDDNEYQQIQNEAKNKGNIAIIQNLLRTEGVKSQKEILEALKDDDNINIGKDKIKLLLSTYIGKYWSMKKTGDRNHINSYSIIETIDNTIDSINDKLK